jgi:hypothetical protein
VSVNGPKGSGPLELTGEAATIDVATMPTAVDPKSVDQTDSVHIRTNPKNRMERDSGNP